MQPYKLEANHRVLRIYNFQQKPYSEVRYTNSEIFQLIISADLSLYDQVFIQWGSFDTVKYTFYNFSSSYP